jgi:hypothetical protein
MTSLPVILCDVVTTQILCYAIMTLSHNCFNRMQQQLRNYYHCCFPQAMSTIVTVFLLTEVKSYQHAITVTLCVHLLTCSLRKQTEPTTVQTHCLYTHVKFVTRTELETLPSRNHRGQRAEIRGLFLRTEYLGLTLKSVTSSSTFSRDFVSRQLENCLETVSSTSFFKFGIVFHQLAFMSFI